MNNISKTRIEELDYVKGLAIFLVIMGHAASNLATPMWRLVIEGKVPVLTACFNSSIFTI